MVTFRPQILKWTTQPIEGEEDENGYPIPASPGEEKVIPCRYHDTIGNGKVYKNEDSTERVQVGVIRCDVGEVPFDGQLVEVVDVKSGSQVFKGTVKEVFFGQLSYRINV